jgi:geranylgeranyl diphosphate synthase type II
MLWVLGKSGNSVKKRIPSLFEKLPLVKKTASHFGLSFQIADDLGDMEQDAKNGRVINMASLLGSDNAKRLLEEEKESFRASLHHLKIATPTLLGLV